MMIRLNASLGISIGWLESAFLIHFIGGLFSIFLLLAFFNIKALKGVSGTPKYLFLGGVLGIAVVCISNWCVAHLGLVLTAGLFLTGNLFFAATADHFGFFGLSIFKISLQRWAGLACAIGGLFLISWSGS